MKPATVKFNVGGRHFEVSRSLIETQFADSVLGRMISDTWQSSASSSEEETSVVPVVTKVNEIEGCDGDEDNEGMKEELHNHKKKRKRRVSDDHSGNDAKTQTSTCFETKNNDDDETALFIDRDGDNFAHILNYMRYGKLYLPYNVSRDLILAELDFYGIPYADTEIELSFSDSHSFQGTTAVKQIKTLRDQVMKEKKRAMTACDRQILELDQQLACILFASFCFQRYTMEIKQSYRRLNKKDSNEDDQDEDEPVLEISFCDATIYGSSNIIESLMNKDEDTIKIEALVKYVNESLKLYDLRIENVKRNSCYDLDSWMDQILTIKSL